VSIALLLMTTALQKCASSDCKLSITTPLLSTALPITG
jgi:hypothetical protein